MQFQPGQSGNPAGRPLGARNKKTIAMEERLDRHAEEAVEIAMRLARGGHPVALRMLMARVMPTGTDRPLALELPEINCADDAQQALNMVTEAFGRGAITVREFPSMLASVDRMARVAERLQQNRESERERYANRRVHGIHPDMIPKPTGEPDPMEPVFAAIARGEDPFPDDPVKSAYVATGERLYSPVNSDDASLPGAAGEGGSPERSEGEPGGGLSQPLDLAMPDRSENDGLYSPVNLKDSAGNAPPPAAADAAPPSPASGGGINEADALYSPVNSAASGDEPLAWENRPALPDGSRLVAVLGTKEGGRAPFYLDPSTLLPDPDPLAEVMRAIAPSGPPDSPAASAPEPRVNPG